MQGGRIPIRTLWLIERLGLCRNRGGLLSFYLRKCWVVDDKTMYQLQKMPDEDRKEMNDMVPVLVLWDG